MAPAIKKVTLKHGLKIGGTVHKDAIIRESCAADLFAAEREATTETPLAFAGALLARQLVRIGTYEGPFTLAMLGTLKSDDFGRLRAAQEAVDALGEAEQESSAIS